MLSVDEALQQVLSRARAKQSVIRPLDESLGRVLAEEVASDMDSPPHDKSIVDGYAVLSKDVLAGRVELEVIEEVTAGAVPRRVVGSGQATRIMTGAPLPAGADAVVMVEQTSATLRESGEQVRLAVNKFTAGQNIMRQGSSMTRGQVVLRPGCVLRAIEIGVLAEVGKSSVSVVDTASVAILATGNELVDAAEVPAPGQIRNSNGPLLVAAARAAGARTIALGIARDEHDEMRQRVSQGLEHDVLVISGGVSAGVLDLVPDALAEAGVMQVFHKIQLKPGKPLWFGVAERAGRDTLVFGLPGNPVSSLVCFELFVRPALGKLAGRSDLGLAHVTAELTTAFQHRGDRPTYHPARLVHLAGRWKIEPLRWRGSGDLFTLTEANALACFAAGDRSYQPGEAIESLRL